MVLRTTTKDENFRGLEACNLRTPLLLTINAHRGRHSLVKRLERLGHVVPLQHAAPSAQSIFVGVIARSYFSCPGAWIVIDACPASCTIIRHSRCSSNLRMAAPIPSSEGPVTVSPA